MIAVEPNTRTSLVLNRNYQSLGVYCTAKAAIRHLMTGRMKGIDADGNVYSWGQENIALHEDQPCLRSAHNRHWPIPTILLCTQHFGFHSRKGENITLKNLYKAYKGTCQYCLNPIPLSQATKDHLYPKSKGGTDHVFNLVLACRKCNSEKDSTYPYFDVNGKEVKSKNLLLSNAYLADNEDIRNEWKPYLFIA